MGFILQNLKAFVSGILLAPTLTVLVYLPIEKQILPKPPHTNQVLIKPQMPTLTPKMLQIPLTQTITATPSETETPLPTATKMPIISNTPLPTQLPTATATLAPTPTPTLIVVNSSDLDDWFTTYANQYGLDRQTLVKIAVCESNLNREATNGIYQGLYQFSSNTWQSTRKSMNLDPDPNLRINAEESIKTAAYKIANGGLSSWPNCY